MREKKGRRRSVTGTAAFPCLRITEGDEDMENGTERHGRDKEIEDRGCLEGLLDQPASEGPCAIVLGSPRAGHSCHAGTKVGNRAISGTSE